MRHYIQYRNAGRLVTHPFTTWDAAVAFIDKLEKSTPELEFSYVRVKPVTVH